MEHFCQTHQKPFKGPNARGNYWHVIDFDKKEYCNVPAADIDKAPYTPKMAEKAAEIREKLADPNWDEIARGKVRNSVAVAFIGQGVKVPGDDVIESMEKWVNWIMGTKEQTS